jgi:hypothetical protein
MVISLKKINKVFIFSLPILYIIGSLSHFFYEWTNNNFLIGLICPINESIYEHTKLAILPLLLFYLVLFIKNRKDKNKILLGFLISLLTTIILIPMLYYFYTSAFGFESTIIDILIFFVAITLGQLLSLHIYNKILNVKSNGIVLIILITYFILNLIFTINPPKLPIFKDPINNSYGLNV